MPNAHFAVSGQQKPEPSAESAAQQWWLAGHSVAGKPPHFDAMAPEASHAKAKMTAERELGALRIATSPLRQGIMLLPEVGPRARGRGVPRCDL